MLQQGTYKPEPLELARRMAETRQFGDARGILHYSVGMDGHPVALPSEVIVKTKFQVGKVTRNDSLFVVDSISGNASPYTEALFFDQGMNPLADALITTAAIWGGNAPAPSIPYFPYILDEPLVVECPTPIQCQIRNVGGGDTTTEAILHGRIVERGAKPYDWFNKRRNRVFPYWMTTPTRMTFSASQNRQFEIKNGNWYFQGLKSTASSTFSGDISFTLTDPISKQVFMNGRTGVESTMGVGVLPSVFDTPMLLKPNSRLVLDVTCITGADTQVWINIFGRKIYARSADEAMELANSKEPR